MKAKTTTVAKLVENYQIGLMSPLEFTDDLRRLADLTKDTLEYGPTVTFIESCGTYFITQVGACTKLEITIKITQI